jgi:hypothetical protein
MRIRSIKPEFWRSRHVAQLPWELRLLFVGLWSYVDDNGVGFDDPWQIAADVFPLDPDPVEVRAKVSEGLARLSREVREGSPVPFIVRYEVAGKRYLYITGWPHQRIDKPSKPRYPLPPDDALTCADSQSDPDPRESVVSPPETLAPVTGEQGNRGTGETTSSSMPRKRGATRGTRIPDDFTVTPEMVEWARQRVPQVDGRLETEKFINHWHSKTGRDATKLDWAATWRNWMLIAAERVPARASPSSSKNRNDVKIADFLGRNGPPEPTLRALPGGAS